MEKRILIAFLLSFAVLYGFRALFAPPVANKPAETKVERVEPVPSTPAPQPIVSTDEKVIRGEAPKAEVVDTSLYHATLSNVGAVLQSIQLKRFEDSEGKPTELIDSYAASQVGYPLALSTGDSALDKTLSQVKFVSHLEGRKVSFEYQEGGIHALKVFDFESDQYRIKVSSELERNGTRVPHNLLLQGEFGDQSKSIVDVPAKRKAVYQAGGRFQRVILTGIKEPQDVTGSLVGVEDQYFLAMFLRDKEGPVKVSKQDYKLPDLADGTKGADAFGLSVAVPSAEPMTLYVGPKQEESLLGVDPRLGGAPDFGWFLFAIIARPLLVVLHWINAFVGNYGWSIILITILINTVLFPLRIKQQLSMQKMQKLAPHLKQLQEKYKKLKTGDPRRAEVEKELMVMNKQQLSGCLPMLLQFPLLIAFLNMMSAAVELRGAPWILWIRDLSLTDPYYILPLLMGAAMFIQMKMSPTSPDPAQAKMMLVTPVLVTLLFLWYRQSAGLTLYWLTGNVISIGQQWFIRNYWTDSA